MEDSMKGKLFEKVKAKIEPHAKNQDIRTDTDKAYHVYGTTTVVIGKKTTEGHYFASSMKNKNFVGFYFFPIYTHKEEFTAEEFPNLMKTLKGKSCFHIKKDDPEVFDEMEKLLQKGVTLYEGLGWR
ncbi:MAG: hypothetical protein CL840_11800 [Crocinitomicaceae bacterium]|nr:hypothetical protein [Crocinitomicaceae bacterium]|tara:strand:- start:1108 stop:1488 length:381 start_codon:yes stop_codon:yes gene_type:complete